MRVAKLVDGNGKSGYDCIDHNISTISCTMGLDYRMCFSHSWNFRFINNTDMRIGNRIVATRENRFFDLERYHGISTRHYINGNLEKKTIVKMQIADHFSIPWEDLFEEILCSFEENRPVSIEIDPYVCEWDNGYNKYHGSHACVLYGFDGCDFLVYDSWYNKTHCRINLDIVKQSFLRIVIFDSGKGNELLFDELLFLKEIAYENSRSNMIDSIVTLSESLGSIDLRNEFEGCNKETYCFSAIDSRLLRVTEQRLQFSYCINYLNRRMQYEQLNDIARMFEHAAELWRNLKTLIAKSFITGNDNPGNLSEKCFGIADYEQRILKQILDVC